MGFDWRAELVFGVRISYTDALKFCVDNELVDAPAPAPAPAPLPKGGKRRRQEPSAQPRLHGDEMDSVLEERGFKRVTMSITHEQDHMDAEDCDYVLCVLNPPGKRGEGATPSEMAAYVASVDGKAALDEFALAYTMLVDTNKETVEPRYMALLRC